MSKLEAMLKEREAEYGDFGDVSAVSQAFKSFVRNRWGGEVASVRQEEALDMICNKLARIICGNARPTPIIGATWSPASRDTLC